MTFPILLGFALVEGLTEFLPVSSTAHLLIVSRLLGIAQTQNHIAFEIAIQCGAIAAALVLERRVIFSRKMLLLVLVGFLPTAVIGFLLHDVVTTLFTGSISVILWALLLGGIGLIVFSFVEKNIRVRVRKVSDMTPIHAVMIGTAQAVALIPGVSRSAVTVVAAQSLGLERAAAVEFSFLLAIPTMGAATALDLVKSANVLTSSDLWTMGMGILLSFIVALAAMRWFLGYVRNHSLAVFGVYRILLAIGVWVWLLR